MAEAKEADESNSPRPIKERDDPQTKDSDADTCPNNVAEHVTRSDPDTSTSVENTGILASGAIRGPVAENDVPANMEPRTLNDSEMLT